MTALACILALCTTPVGATTEVRDVTVFLHGDTLEVSTRVVDPEARLATLELRYWAVDGEPTLALMTRDTERATARVPAAPLFAGGDSVRILYTLVGRDAGGGELFTFGSVADPHSVIVTRVVRAEDLGPVLAPTPPAPWYASWWFWVAVAGVVAAAGATTAVVLATTD